ncbi:hypothetical protein ABB37_00841 [Leptomonas pyrrhocoris]|uniref:Uncharacterized protein n=1 Tax=Leptomonas pyrrhocoris TaxID=157538 RepID=A0A0N0VI38_LEPPY|nr:hypothetical protein ABB37_00841 [Leptomonas pyrrhocoris]KPA86774.1 hypothetical protein ABB37_00841 [Leptomonas pyrrhocoris]|eukprot:XP_015665213.1 hypothetical protein ABB37_00841 [Leptomonas pyrrhocoris]
MSSLNDGSGPTKSQNDSIPLDDEESSMSIYSDEEEGEYDPSNEPSEVGHSSLDYSSVSRTYLSQSQSRGPAPQSEDYTATASYYSNGAGGSNSYGYDDEDYEYSSGYDSMTYGDASLRSPNSELSSTFASFYYENEFMIKARSTLRFLRRPLYYFAFAAAGSGAVGSVFRLATTVVKRHLDSGVDLVDASLSALPGGAGSALQSAGLGAGAQLPSGYPNVPAWLQEVRASLPSVVEAPAAWLLQRNNIPVLSDLVSQQQQKQLPISATASARFGSQVSSGVQEAWCSWQKTGPAIPVALFLPLFSVVAVKVAQHVRPNPHSLSVLLRAQQDAEDAEVASAYLSTTSPARPVSLSASPIVAAAAGTAAGDGAAASALSSARSTSSMDVPPTSRAAAPSPPQVPPVDIASATRAAALDDPTATPEARQPAAGTLSRNNVSPTTTGITPSSTDDFASEPRERSRSTTQAPLTHRHVAGDGVEEEDIDVDTGARVQMPSASAAAKGDAYDPAAKPKSPAPQPPQPAAALSVAGSTVTTGSTTAQGRLGQQRGSTLRGDVVAAVAGTPDVREANVALVAAARYGCSAVLLPASLEHAAGLLEAPPSLAVEFVHDVVVSAVGVAGRRGLALLGVTAQRWDARSLPLDTFAHPVNALYLFVSHESDSPAAVAAMSEVVQQSVFLGTSRGELPANQVFYDRLRKEKAAS